MAIPFREAILRRAESKCQLCGEFERLEVHHIKHELSSVDDLIVACKPCHSALHQIEKTLRKGWVDDCFCYTCGQKFIHPFEYYQKNKKMYIYVCPECGVTTYGIVTTGETQTVFPSGNTIIPRIKEYLIKKGVSFTPSDLALRLDTSPITEERALIEEDSKKSLSLFKFSHGGLLD